MMRFEMNSNQKVSHPAFLRAKTAKYNINTIKISITTPQKLVPAKAGIENMFGRLKDGMRIFMRYDRQPHTFFSAIQNAATLILYCMSPAPG